MPRVLSRVSSLAYMLTGSRYWLRSLDLTMVVLFFFVGEFASVYSEALINKKYVRLIIPSGMVLRSEA